MRRFFASLLFALWCFVVAAPAMAQPTPGEVDYARWESLVRRAELSVETGRASDLALETLRAQLDDWRHRFNDAMSLQSVKVRSLKSQIDHLGPVPETGEPDEIAGERKVLSDALAAAQAPARRAGRSFTETETLIHSIDALLRARQAQALFELAASPVNPARWGGGLEALVNSITQLSNEITTSAGNANEVERALANWPRVVFFLFVGLVLIIRGRALANRLLEEFTQGEISGRRWLMAFFLSLGQILLPLGGIYLITEAIYATALPGLRGDLLLSRTTTAGAALLVSLWLGARAFPRAATMRPLLDLTDDQRTEGRLLAHVTGWLLVAHVFLKELSRYDNWSVDAVAVVYFPLLVLVSGVIYRLARLLVIHSRHEREQASEEGDRKYFDGLVGLAGRMLQLIAFAGIVLAAVGYSRAAQGVLFPTILSLQLIVFLALIQRLFNSIYGLVTKSEDQAQDSLLLVFVGLTLVALAVPILALIWGARLSDLYEIWARVSYGISLGDVRISPRDVLVFVAVFAVGYGLTRLAQGVLKNTVLPKTSIDKGGQAAVVSGMGYVGVFLAAIVAITSAGINLSNIALVAGALSVGIGFGLQTIVQNFISGIILLIERPISEGDWIEVNGQMGYVRDISVRATRIETFDRTDVIVPNGDLVTGMVTNYTRGNTIGRVIVPVGAAYGTDPRKVERILLEIATAHPMVLAIPAPSVVFQGFGADSLDFEIRAILRDVNWVLTVRSDMNYDISRRFEELGIEIPFAQRDVWIRNPEALSGQGAVEKAGPAAPPTPREAAPERSLKQQLTESDMDGSDGDGGGDGDGR